MTDTLSASPDLQAIKQRQQQTWASGDFHAIAEGLEIELLDGDAEALPFADGPTVKAFAALDDSEPLRRDLVALARRHDRLGTGAVAIAATYLEAVARRR